VQQAQSARLNYKKGQLESHGTMKNEIKKKAGEGGGNIFIGTSPCGWITLLGCDKRAHLYPLGKIE
jgi:hypothetical protein